MGRYIENDHPEAEALFERLIDYPFAKSLHTELHRFSKATGHQIRLKYEPLEIVKVEGFLTHKNYLISQWVEVPIEYVCHMGRVLDIPPSILQVPYSEVRVQYYAGAEVIPEGMKKAVQEISNLMKNSNANSWNLPLSHDTLTTINKYKRR